MFLDFPPAPLPSQLPNAGGSDHPRPTAKVHASSLGWYLLTEVSPRGDGFRALVRRPREEWESWWTLWKRRQLVRVPG